ncbi:MAG: DUF1844 domain-containing protein [Sedimentisphaerales bacterium]|nr:DUF1844 domain-containing protein [Sedimentisphaerales bacterium]
MEEEKKEDKKLIIDEDWKHQAQREKEILSAQEKTQQEKPQAQKTRPGPLPKGNFAALVSTLVTQALFAMGMIKVEGPQREPDLEMARYHIDMLETLEEKTKGNLTEDEQKVLSNTLNEVRMAYVKVSGD